MKQIALLILVLLTISCNSEKKNLKKRVTKISSIVKNELKDNNIEFAARIGYEDKKQIVDVNIVFDEPYRITDKDIQLELLSYIAYQIIDKKLITDIEKLHFTTKYRTDPAKSYGGVFDNSTDFKKFEDETYVKLIKYCFKNFEMGYGYYFDVRIEYFLSSLPFTVEKDNFIDLLKHFSKTKRASIHNNADVIFLLYYSYNKILINANLASKEKLKLRKAEMKIIKGLWFIAKGKDIDEEKDFENEVLDPKNHKQK